MLGTQVEQRRPVIGRDRMTWVVLAGVLVLAAVLRMGWPTLAEFKLDEAMVIHRALAIAYEGDLPAEGAGASVGPAHLPLQLYLMAIPLRVQPDPLAAVLFVGMLHVLAVLACYAFGRLSLGRGAGLIAAFLFAVSPWAVIYGRKIWSQNQPLVTLGFFAALFITFARGRRWALVAAFAGLAALIGFHLGGLAFVLVLLAAMLLFRKRVSFWPLVAGGLLFLVALSPYCIHDALTGWSNLQGFLHYAGGESHFSWDALRYAFMLAGGEGMQGMAGVHLPAYLAGLPDLWWVNRLMTALVALALVHSLLRVVRGPEEKRCAHALMLLWLLVPVAMQSRTTAPVQPHYFILLYPVQFLLVGAMLGDGLEAISAWRRPRRRVHALLILVLVLALLAWGAWQVAVVGRLFLFMEHYPVGGGYGIPLRYPRTAAREARQLAGSAEIIVLANGANVRVDETPAVFEALLFDHPHRFADGRWALPVPDGTEAVYLVGLVEQEGASELAPAMDRLEQMAYVQPGPEIPLPGGSAYALFRREGAGREDVLAAMTRFPMGIPFANGVVFVGYQVAERVSPGEPLEVWLAWAVGAAPPAGVDYHFFAHLLDAEGSLRAQHDGVGFSSSSWRAGDVVVSRFSIPIPPDLPLGRYRVWSGMYAYPEVINVSFLDEAGNPAGERVGLGEVEVEVVD